MSTKNIIFGLVFSSFLLSSTSAMFDENAQKSEKLENRQEVRIMNTSVNLEETMSWKRVQEQIKRIDWNQERMWSGNMSDPKMNNASWTGVMKSENWQARSVEAKMNKEKIKEKVGKNADKAEMRMNKFQEKFERKTKQEKLNQYQALCSKIDKTIEKFENSDISEEKKEAYRNLFEYIRNLNEEKIALLEEESEEIETATWTVVE